MSITTVNITVVKMKNYNDYYVWQGKYTSKVCGELQILPQSDT